MHNDAQANLSGVFQDILVQIMALLDAPDILSLRRCSKTLQSASHARILWIRLFRELLATHNILPSTFPIETSNQKMLEHISTSPHRFLARLRRGVLEDAGAKLEPLSTRSLTTGRSRHRILHKFTALKLVPGGRFVVTATQLGLVELWDLGLDSSASFPKKSKPMATVEVGDMNFGHEGIQLIETPVNDGTGIYMLAISDEEDEVQLDVFILNIFTPSPNFHHVGKYAISVDQIGGGSIYFGPDLILACIDSEITVWNYVSDSWGCLTEVPYDMDMITVRDNELIAVDRSNGVMLVYRLPFLHPRNPDAEATTETAADIPETTFGEEAVWVATPANSQVSLTNTGFWRLRIARDDGTSSQYALHAMGNLYGKVPPMSVPGLFDSSHKPLDRTTTLPGVQDKDQEVFLDWSPSSQYTLRASLTGSALCVWMSNERLVPMDYCPVSGRLCVGEGTQILVMDYLRSPPST
ncbi:hypothetical protein JAAARDRAFT_489185 [Jaapia argillacea MUCL 33604]|uniref:F-box domain-containing protein n=1 Tax=Jaapia argillacea MUCL 33604 TaxID=933084 RepID=A0A067PP07_9AGAM|nr:hypothetical protein JAAARDRAFT_489185 [Jaapia argillacea MUCL 33604]